MQSLVWLSYRILRHTCHIHFIRKHYVAHFSDYGTSSGAGFGTYTITAHHYAALSLLPVSVHPAQVVHPVLCSTCYARYRHTSFAPPDCIHIYRSSFYLFCGSHEGASAGIATWSQTIPTTNAHQVPKSTLNLLNILHLLNLKLNLNLNLIICLQTTPMLSRCTAATVNSWFIVWLLPGACFLRHCQGSWLLYLFFSSICY